MRPAAPIIWADRFEGALEDVFAFQDEVTAKVVAAIAPRVERAEIERAKRRPTEQHRCLRLLPAGLGLFLLYGR